MPPAPPPASRPQHWLWPLLLLLGSITLAIAWLMVALATGSQAGWMAIAAAAEAAWMLRLGTLAGGRTRIAVAMLATLPIDLPGTGRSIGIVRRNEQHSSPAARCSAR